MTTTTSEVSALVSIIANAASTIESYHKATETKPHLPSLDDVEPHPLDHAAYPLDIRHAVQTLEGACMQLCATVARPGHTMLNKYMRIFESACIGVALRTQVAEILLDHPSGMHLSELSRQCGVESGKLGRVLRLLCSNHIFREVSQDVFANNRLSMQLLKSNPLSGFGNFYTDELITKAVFSLADNLLDPERGHSYATQDSCFNHSAGYPHPLWVYFESKNNYKGPELGACASRGMVGWNREATDALEVLSTGYPWEKLSNGSTVNDVGGGSGSVAMLLCERHPHLRLKLQDSPERIEEAKTKVWPSECPSAIEEKRIEFKAMDFLEELPIPNCDIYLLKNVIHNWPDNEAIKILSNISKAMGSSSRVLIYEYIMQGVYRRQGNESEVKQAPSPLLPNHGAGGIRQYNLDLALMTLFNTKTHGLSDYIELGKAAGLQYVKLWDLGEMGLIEFALSEHREPQ